MIDGETLKKTKENNVLRVAFSLKKALGAMRPETVAEAVVERYRLGKQAGRNDKAAIAALSAALRGKGASFAARGDDEARKVTLDLPPFPIRDPATLKLRQAQNRAWSAAPPAARASVPLRMPFDSYALGATAQPKDWPEWQGRPTIVADPLTDMDGVRLTTIKSMGALAKSLVVGEKGHIRNRSG